MRTEDINRSTFPGTRHACNTDADAPPAVRQAFLNHLLCYLLVLIFGTFHQGDGLTENGDISLQNALHKLRRRVAFALNPSFEIGIHGGHVGNALIDFQALVLLAVFRMFHDVNYQLLLLLPVAPARSGHCRQYR